MRFDWVQPDKERMARIEMTPARKVRDPTRRGVPSSLSVTGNGKPSVVIMMILVTAKIATKKEPVATVASRNIAFIRRPVSALSRNRIRIVNEKPPIKAQMRRIWLAR